MLFLLNYVGGTYAYHTTGGVGDALVEIGGESHNQNSWI